MSQALNLEPDIGTDEIQFPEESVFQNILSRLPSRLECSYPLWPTKGQLHDYCKAPVRASGRQRPYCPLHCAIAYVGYRSRATPASKIIEDLEPDPPAIPASEEPS
jgi:hypothetical protein